MKRDPSLAKIPPSPRLEMRLDKDVAANADVRLKQSACLATDAPGLCVPRCGEAYLPVGSSSSEESQAKTMAHWHEDETVARVVSTVVELFRSEKTGNSGKNIALYRVLESAMAILRASAENNERRASRLAPWQECAAKTLMTRDLACPPTLETLALECGMSKNSFVEAFRACTGLPPRQWLISFRISRAQDMLARSRETLSIIAIDCGFCDQSHFTRTFARVTGMTPATWRRQSRTPSLS